MSKVDMSEAASVEYFKKLIKWVDEVEKDWVAITRLSLSDRLFVPCDLAAACFLVAALEYRGLRVKVTPRDGHVELKLEGS